MLFITNQGDPSIFSISLTLTLTLTLTLCEYGLPKRARPHFLWAAFHYKLRSFNEGCARIPREDGETTPTPPLSHLSRSPLFLLSRLRDRVDPTSKCHLRKPPPPSVVGSWLAMMSIILFLSSFFLLFFFHALDLTSSLLAHYIMIAITRA